MLKPVLKPVCGEIRKYLSTPSVRFHSNLYRSIQGLFSYDEHEKMLKMAMDYVKNSRLEGDYLEFGVYRGNSFSLAFHFATADDLNHMKFYAFDSFSGLPSISGIDQKGFQHFEKKQYACDEREFRSILTTNRVDLRKVEIVPGYYSDVLTPALKQRIKLKKAAVIMVDCDLYESTVPVLEFISNIIQDGTLIIFDDWYCFRGNPHRGEQRAFSEWLQKNPEWGAIQFHRYALDGLSFILYKNTNGE